MKVVLCNVALFLCLSAVADTNGSFVLETRFRQVSKGTIWKETGQHKLNFNTHHPQGMTAVGERFFLSAVEVIDREQERGIGHLYEIGRRGTLLRETTLGEGEVYHPGGIDYDGTSIWVPVAAYRPDSASIVYAVSPDTLEIREVFRFKDHLGAIAHFPDKNILVAVSWGSRRFYRWETVLLDGTWIVPDPEHPKMQLNGNHYIDYQDMQRIPGTPWLLCSGLQTYAAPGKKLPSLRIGGIDLVNTDQLLAHHQVPVPTRPPAAPAWTQNPFYVETRGDTLCFFFIPEDNKSFIHMFEIDAKK